MHYAVLETCSARFVQRAQDDARLEIVEKMHREFRAHPMPGHLIDASGDPASVADAFRAGRLLL